MKNILYIIIAVMLLNVFCGCNKAKEKTVWEKYPAVLRGRPVSVAQSSYSDAYLSVVLEVDNKYVLVSSNYEYVSCVANAMAVIQSEISDGDEEIIELRGDYSKSYGEKGRFIIKYVKANGIEVEFK